MELTPAAIHVDLDGATDIFQSHGWAYDAADDPLFETGMEGFLELFAEARVHATLFVVARDVDNPAKRRLLERAAKLGHEIASHTVTHRHLPRLSSSDKRTEIFESKGMLEDAFGVRVHGFRAPGYLLDRESLELLAEAGYRYDSSAFATPAHAARLRLPVSELMRPSRPLPGSDLIEWPMPDHRPSPLPFNPSYALLLGNWYFDWGLRRHKSRGIPLALLFHLIDAAGPLPTDRHIGVGSRVWTLSVLSAATKRRRVRSMLAAALSRYRLTTTLALVDEWSRLSSGLPSARALAPSPS
jgi:hypothetical protein